MMTDRKHSFFVLACCLGIGIQLLTTLSFVTAAPIQQQESVNRQSPQLIKDGYYNIGSFQRNVTTSSDNGQLWFDRGLAMCYAFNHEEAVRCFKKAVAADPGMAMAYWGLAYAMGPNINNMEIASDQMAQANFCLQLAQLHEANSTELERKLIAALAKRYQTPIPELDQRAPLYVEYANELRLIHKQFPDDPTVTALFAESLMNLSPWMQWTKEGKPTEHTAELVETLELALKKWPDHPALCHQYIHAMEASPHPEKALRAANRLRNAMPGCGHLVHMPSHIDVLVGDYQSVVSTNQKAIVADNLFLKNEGPLNFYTLYRIHNFHFVVYGAMFEGRSEVAMSAARELVSQIPGEMLEEQTDFLDAFVPMPLHVMIRFGQWDSILQEAKPPTSLPMSLATWHYARTLAFAAKQQVAKARLEYELFKVAKSKVPESSVLFQNRSLDILSVAEQMMLGEIDYRAGNYDGAFTHLREAVLKDDALNYDEPWGWMQPARHALGALLLEQNKLEEAEAVYREDLRRRPNNAWSLHGLMTCLEKLDRAEEADKCRQQFEKASQRADIRIDRSCFCKLK